MIRRTCIIATRGHQNNVDPATRADVKHHLAKPYSADALIPPVG